MRYMGAEYDNYTALASAQLRVECATSLLAFVYLFRERLSLAYNNITDLFDLP